MGFPPDAPGRANATPPAIGRPAARPVRAGSPVVRLRVHQDMLEWLEHGPSSLRGAALRAMEALVAYGRPSRVKGVHGVNRGWSRTPVGGSGGMHWYLWYVGRGAEPIGDRLAPGEILVRGVRHHDDTDTPVSTGHERDWLSWSPRDLLLCADAPGVMDRDHPLALDQREALTSTEPVQILRGTPGAGKTTTLLHGVRRLAGRVLYVTFSAGLAERATAWLAELGAGDGEISVSALPDLIARMAARPAFTDPRARVVRRLMHERLDPYVAQLGPWREGASFDAELLHAEIHAQIFGRVHGSAPAGPSGGSALTARASYVAERAAWLGETGAAAAWDAARLLAQDEDVLFPGPFAARVASARAREGHVPEGLGELDWIVVDEVQDLTLAEVDAVLELARAAGRRRGRVPGVRFAGDEGQTLRPTGFAWSDLEGLARERLHPPEVRALSVNVRSSREVAAFLQQLTSCLYRRLPKGLRPAGQRRATVEPAAGGQVLLVREPFERFEAVMDALAGIDAVIVPRREVPPALAERARGHRLLSSEQAKGLDFGVTAVLDLGAAVATVHGLVDEAATVRLAMEQARSLADHARVAVSRAVDRLVLVELTTGDARADAAARLALDAVFAAEDHDAEAHVASPSPTPIADLAALLDIDTGDALARLHAALAACGSLLDRDRPAALAEAERAVAELCRAGHSGAVDDRLRAEVRALHARAREAALREEAAEALEPAPQQGARTVPVTGGPEPEEAFVPRRTEDGAEGPRKAPAEKKKGRTALFSLKGFGRKKTVLPLVEASRPDGMILEFNGMGFKGHEKEDLLCGGCGTVIGNAISLATVATLYTTPELTATCWVCKKINLLAVNATGGPRPPLGEHYMTESLRLVRPRPPRKR